MASHTNDHELKIGTTTKKFKIIRNDQGRALYDVIEDVPQYQDPLRFFMMDWQGGHGQYDFNQEDVYFDGQSIDTTQEGKVILGPLIYQVGLAAASLGANPVCFCWFSAISKLMVATATKVFWYDGTNFVEKWDATAIGTIRHMIEFNGILYIAFGDSVKYYFSPDGASYTQTNLTDGYAVKFFNSPNAAGTANVLWKYKTPNEVSSTTDGGAITFEPDSVQKFTDPATYTDYTTEVTDDLSATHAAMDAFASTGFLYVGDTVKFGRVVVDMGANVNANASVLSATYWNGAWVALTITDGTISSAKTLAQDGAITFTIPTDWATTTVNSVASKYWVRFAVSATLSATVDINEIDLYIGAVANSTGVEWSSPAYIGDKSNNITNIFLVNDNLLIGREDNLLHYDADGGIHSLMGDLKHNRSTNNFKYVTEWQTASYFSLGTGLGEITAYDAFEPMGPLTKIDDIGKAGVCVGLTSDKDFIYAVMDEGTYSHIYKGRERRTAKGLRWEWCPWVYLGTNACATVMVVQHTATDRRLWFGYGNYAGFVKLYDNPLADTSATYATTGWVRFSYTYGTNPYWDKMFQSVVTETSGCTANITVTPKYRSNATISMADLTAAITSNGVVKTNLTAEISCKRIQFELDLVTNSSTVTPIITYFEARGIEKPETVRTHEVTYAVGTEPGKTTETIRTFLRGGRTSTSLIKFTDLRYGDSTEAGTNYVWVIMCPGYPREVEILHEKGASPELGIQCRFQECSFTVS